MEVLLDPLRDAGCERGDDDLSDFLRKTGTYLRSGQEGSRLLLLPSSKTSRSFAPIPSKAGREGGSHGSTIPRFLFRLASSPGFQPIPRSNAPPN